MSESDTTFDLSGFLSRFLVGKNRGLMVEILKEVELEEDFMHLANAYNNISSSPRSQISDVISTVLNLASYQIKSQEFKEHNRETLTLFMAAFFKDLIRNYVTKSLDIVGIVKREIKQFDREGKLAYEKWKPLLESLQGYQDDNAYETIELPPIDPSKRKKEPYLAWQEGRQSLEKLCQVLYSKGWIEDQTTLKKFLSMNHTDPVTLEVSPGFLEHFVFFLDCARDKKFLMVKGGKGIWKLCESYLLTTDCNRSKGAIKRIPTKIKNNRTRYQLTISEVDDVFVELELSFSF